MSKLVCIKGLNQGDEFPIREGVNVIGRGDKCDIALFDRKCSHSHCKLSKNGKYHVIEDVGSTNGTSLNHKRLKPNKSKSLKIGDHIRIGQTVLVLSDKSVGDVIEQTATDVAADLQERGDYAKLFDDAAAELMKGGRRRKPETLWEKFKDFFSSSPGKRKH